MTIGLSVLTGAIGVAGGVLLGRTALQRQRKVLGIPISRTVDIDLRGVGQRVGDAGRRVGSLAGELRSVREKAEKIGDALTLVRGPGASPSGGLRVSGYEWRRIGSCSTKGLANVRRSLALDFSSSGVGRPPHAPSIQAR